MASELGVPKRPPPLLSPALRDAGPREAILPTTRCLLPPTRIRFCPSSTSACSKSRIWFPWKPHLAPPHLCNSVGLAWQQRVRVSCYPIPAREPPPGVHQSPSDPSSRSSQGSPAVRQPRLEGGLLLPAKSARPTSLLQAGWSSKAALAPRLSPLLGFAGSALTVPHAPPLPPSARQPPRSSKCQEPSTGVNPGRGPCRGAESQRHPKSAKVPTRPGCQ